MAPPAAQSAPGKVDNPMVVTATLYQQLQKKVSGVFADNLKNQAYLQGASKKAPKAKGVVDEQDKALWSKLPRRETWYEPMLLSLARVSKDCLDATVKLLLEWMPSYSNTFAQFNEIDPNPNYGSIEQFNFDSFLKTIVDFDSYDLRQWDLVECVVDLVLADTLYCCLLSYDGANVSPLLLKTLKELNAFFHKPREPKWALHAALWHMLRADIADQWASILGLVSGYSNGLDPNELLQVASTAANPEEMAAYYRGFRHLRFHADIDDARADQFVSKLSDAVDNAKTNKAVKPLMIEVMNSTLACIDFSRASFAKVAERASDIFKKAYKWLKVEELEAGTLKLMCTILTHGPLKLQEDEMDLFLSKKLLKNVTKDKKQGAYLDAILRLLRGLYVGPRISWEPAPSLIKESVEHQFNRPKESPYAFAPLADNQKKMGERMKTITLTLFSKKQLIKGTETHLVDTLVDTVLQIAAHSMAFTRETIFPTLFNERAVITVHQLIGLRALRIILDKKSGFWENASWVQHPKGSVVEGKSSRPSHAFLAQEHAVPREELERIFESTLMKLYAQCDSQAGFAALGRNNNLLRPSACKRPADMLFYEFRKGSPTSSNQLMSEKAMDAVVGWYDTVNTDPVARERTLAKELEGASKKVGATVQAWLDYSRISLPVVVDEPPPEKKAERRGKKPCPNDKLVLLELFKECILSIPLSLPADIMSKLSTDPSFFGQLIVHDDNDLAELCSHSMQHIMFNNPQHRIALVQGLVNFAKQYDYQEPIGMQVALSQLLLLLNLWVSLKYEDGASAQAAHNDPPASLIKEIEALAMVNLCQPFANIRCMCLQLVRTMAGLKVDIPPTVSYVLDCRSEPIMQRARYRFLLDTNHGVDQVRVVRSETQLDIGDVAKSDNDQLWTYVLAEVGNACVDMGIALSALLVLVQDRLNSLPAVPTDASSDATENALKVVRRNYMALMFSTCSSLCIDESETSIQANFNEWLNNRTSGVWQTTMMSDIEWVREGVIVSCGGSHWRGFATVLTSLHSWYSALDKRKKPKARVNVSCVLRHVTQDPSFPEAINDSAGSGLVNIFVEFFKEFEGVFGSLPKQGNEYYFVDNALILINVCSALYKRKYYTFKGPVRRSLTSSLPEKTNWAVVDRFNIYRLFLEWHRNAPVEDISSDKSLQKIKDPAVLEKKKAELRKAGADVMFVVRHVVEKMARLGVLFPENQRAFKKETVDWIMTAEHQGNTILRWVLSFHFQESFALFVQRTYESPLKESIVFVHAIFDQFTPLVDRWGPTCGITAVATQYHQMLALVDDNARKLESSPLSDEDRELTKHVTEKAGVLLLLMFFNTVHPVAEIRERAFAMIARLVPTRMGALTGVQEDSAAAALRTELELFSGAYATDLIDISRRHALEASRLTAGFCADYTEKLFTEAFHRLPLPMLSINQKLWILDFLLPWCDNIVLDKDGTSSLSEHTPDAFLENIFQKFTLELVKEDMKMPPELTLLYQHLADASPGNHKFIINFLVTTASAYLRDAGSGHRGQDHLDVCRALVVQLYKINPQGTLEPLMYHLSYTGVQDMLGDLSDEKRDKQGSKEKARQAHYSREAIVPMLKDVLSDAIDPVLPHIHILLQWSVMRLNSIEGPTLRSLLLFIVLGLTRLVQQQKPTAKLMQGLADLTASLRKKSFHLKWNLTGYHKRSVWKPLDADDAKSMMAPVETDAMELYTGKEVLATDVISLLCSALELLGGDAIDRWGQEALEWATGYKDLQLSIIAHQTYRIIPAPISQQSINCILEGLVECVEKMEKGLEMTIKAAKGEVKISSRTLEQKEKVIALARGKAIESLLTLQKIVPVLREILPMYNIFWVAVSLARLPHPPFSQLYMHALRLLLVLHDAGFFASLDATEIERQKGMMATAKEDWVFSGIAPLLIIGLSMHSTERIAAKLLTNLMKTGHAHLVSTQPSRYSVSLVALLTWIHHECIVKRFISSGDFIAGEVALEVADGLAHCTDCDFSKSMGALKNLAKNGMSDTAGADLVKLVVSDLHAQCIPDHALDLADTLSTLLKAAPRFAESVLAVTREFFAKPDAPAFVASFKEIIRLTTDLVADRFLISSQTISTAVQLLIKSPGIATSSVSTSLHVLKPDGDRRAVRHSAEALRVLFSAMGQSKSGSRLYAGRADRTGEGSKLSFVTATKSTSSQPAAQIASSRSGIRKLPPGPDRSRRMHTKKKPEKPEREKGDRSKDMLAQPPRAAPPPVPGHAHSSSESDSETTDNTDSGAPTMPRAHNNRTELAELSNMASSLEYISVGGEDTEASELDLPDASGTDFGDLTGALSALEKYM
mmetsp:Transcript_34161/g.85733  ORF Transcript_34161/g.85733 Transcript_34161/m.85733 type:complete len:2326 (-) Transcript_34161:173-7150(-)|eukprot:CAMPEP_0177670314 /NCGR_PEP_ID=MMETSP0447-20121125/24010_1 /TAXON_ID=0 /ORGANISM="Stygamoeba regulata, Strain BSH-02190019" /LENGTH=2325 /DNA_ID=CAMNT_0019177443 /DNA_START=210 /DNA_END=7187 /DNA_ORIENTATION=-